MPNGYFNFCTSSYPSIIIICASVANLAKCILRETLRPLALKKLFIINHFRKQKERVGKLLEALGTLLERCGKVLEDRGTLLERFGKVPECVGTLLERFGKVPERVGSLLEHVGQLLEHFGTLLEHYGKMQEDRGALLERCEKLPEPFEISFGFLCTLS